MSDTTGTEPTAAEPQGAAPATGAEPQGAEEVVDWKAKFEQERANARTWETRSKENFEKAKQFDELQEASKSELQKALDRAAAAEERAAKAETARLRSDIARTKGVEETLLQGSTEDELNAYADQLLAWRGAEQPAAPRSSGGDAPSGAAKPTVYSTAQLNDPEFFQAHRADILKAYAEGRITS